ncbi:MAG: hypothetical protein KBA51_00705 [Kiritimatiellae bacterium]|nr:hypothetical protein [Kiritimatiellia bacterium]
MRQFDQFLATELWCPTCRSAQPVRERLLLVLPGGELHEYRCTQCASSLGTREVRTPVGMSLSPSAAAPRPRPAKPGRSAHTTPNPGTHREPRR